MMTYLGFADVGTGNSTFTSDEPTSGVEEIKRMPQGFHESSAYINFFMHAQKESKKSKNVFYLFKNI